MRRNWIVWYVITTHLVWGVIILIDNTTLLSPFLVDSSLLITKILGEVQRSTVKIQWIISITMFIASFLSIIGLILDDKIKRFYRFLGFIFLLPQQFIVTLTSLGAVSSIQNRIKIIIVSNYDPAITDYLFPGKFVIEASFGILIAIFHTIAILNFYLKRY